jgi:hypothetical protein
MKYLTSSFQGTVSFSYCNKIAAGVNYLTPQLTVEYDTRRETSREYQYFA